MSTHTAPDSTMSLFQKPKRKYVACLNCRNRKIKCISDSEDTPCERCTRRGYLCEYKAVCEVSEEQAKAGSHGGPRPSLSYMPTSLNQSSNGPGGSNRGDAPDAVYLYHPHQNPSSSPFNSGPGGQGSRPPHHSQFPPSAPNTSNYGAMNAGSGQTGPMYSGRRPPPQPQFPTSGPSTYGGTQGQLSHTPHGPSYARPPFPNQQPGFAGYPSDYQRYMANFGLDDTSYQPNIYPGNTYPGR
ncbi:hypothetical protein DFH09DRAFT_548063 [Mycena vulgaris]|nr:hypothetical protein DFH09DRAFT_548063 [Mycena vulgaris]